MKESEIECDAEARAGPFYLMEKRGDGGKKEEEDVSEEER